MIARSDNFYKEKRLIFGTTDKKCVIIVVRKISEESMQNLLLSSYYWILDVAFFVALIVGIAVGTKRGFVKSVCKLAGKWFALIFAVCFCVSFANFLGVLGLTGAIANGLANCFAKNETLNIALTAEVSGTELTVALEELGVGKFYIFLIGLGFKNVELVPEGVTAAQLLGSTIAKWIVIVIAFVLLILIVRVGFTLFGKLCKGLIDKISPLRVIDQTLGGIFGLLKSFVLIFLILLVCNWLPIDGLHEFISGSSVVGAIFNSNWFLSAASYAVSGEWFTDYLADVVFQ